MLSKLTIKNVALIERADITFTNGLNVLSGETGAGKSVILDSVNFVLGAKADRSMIRYGEEECMVKAEFFVSETSVALEVLREFDIESDGEIIISRKFSDSGKNSIKINGNTVTATMLRKVTDSLVDVHGQSEHFFLLKESNQLRLLDQVVGTEIVDKKETLQTFLKARKQIDEKIAFIGGDEKERGRRLDVLKFQIDEIEAVDLKDGEEDALLVKRNKIHNLEKIISAVSEAVGVLSEEGGVSDGLRCASRAMIGISKLDETYQEICEKLESIALDVEDATESLSNMGDDLYFDEREAEETEQRLDAIRALKRKYGSNKEEIDEYLQKIQSEYQLLSDCEGQYAFLSAERVKTEDEIFKICKEISQLRKKHGQSFCKRVTEELKTLNIANAKFDIQFNDYEKSDVKQATSNGLDEITFLFSANAGEPLKPLGKIISGGEMSRFMLAIKTQISAINDISTYIFDEIDAGISGKTAKVVGEKLANISKDTQIIAVSHLAQIAVMSDKEYLIEKIEENNKTLTHVHALSEEDKTREIVRLLGGEEKDEYALKHAEELMKQAKEYKHSIN